MGATRGIPTPIPTRSANSAATATRPAQEMGATRGTPTPIPTTSANSARTTAPPPPYPPQAPTPRGLRRRRPKKWAQHAASHPHPHETRQLRGDCDAPNPRNGRNTRLPHPHTHAKRQLRGGSGTRAHHPRGHPPREPAASARSARRAARAQRLQGHLHGDEGQEHGEQDARDGRIEQGRDPRAERRRRACGEADDGRCH